MVLSGLYSTFSYLGQGSWNGTRTRVAVCTCCLPCTMYYQYIYPTSIVVFVFVWIFYKTRYQIVYVFVWQSKITFCNEKPPTRVTTYLWSICCDPNCSYIRILRAMWKDQDRISKQPSLWGLDFLSANRNGSCFKIVWSVLWLAGDPIAVWADLESWCKSVRSVVMTRSGWGPDSCR